MKRVLLLVCLGAALWTGCARKESKPQIAGWAENTGLIQLPGFQYPQNWIMTSEGGSRYMVYSSQEVIERFYDYTVRGKDGARLVVWYDRMDTLKTLDQAVNELKNTLSASGFVISEVTASPVRGVPGTAVHYSGFVDAKNKLEAVQVQAVRDSFLVTIKYEAFNKAFASSRAVLDTALATFRFPVSKKDLKPEDLQKPSSVYKTYEDATCKISLPDNFGAATAQLKAPIVYSLDVKGDRADCTLRIDILPAQNQTLEKVVEQNSKFFKATSQGEATVAGAKSIYLNYSPQAGVQSRAYFIVKEDKMVRIIFNYYQKMKDDFLPAFEKMVGSIQLK
ncbi:hypothetical protein JW777_00115 [bacterium]|nr:hypothetical protein [bacterium]